MTSYGTILDRVLAPLGPKLTVEMARALVSLQISEADQRRLDELADRNTEGQLTPEEREEYAAWVSACDLVGILQAKSQAVRAAEHLAT